MSSDIAIRVTNLSKCYQIYDNPRDRLKQFVFPGIKRALGRQANNYYREFWALRDVSFEVKRGESIGIIGRNGAGKSTLLQIITGVLTPTSGNVEVKGRVAALLELGSGFNPDFSGRENVYMNASILGLNNREIEAKYQDIVNFADIGEFIEQPVKTYSSGMMMRLAFAVHACIEPEVLIVDEALGVGDALFQKKCSDRLHELKGKGITLIFVSHDVFLVRQLCEKALFIEKGHSISYGDSETVTRDYYKLLFPTASSQASSVSTNDPIAVGLRKNGESNEMLKCLGVQMISVPEKISWGYGGIILRSLTLSGCSIPGGFKEEDRLLFEMEFVCDESCVRELAKEHNVFPKIYFGIRIDTDKSVVVCDVVENAVLVYEDNLDEIINVNFSIIMPALKPGNYFFTPGVALGNNSQIIALASYDNMITLRSEPTIQFIGLIDIKYSVERF